VGETTGSNARRQVARNLARVIVRRVAEGGAPGARSNRGWLTLV